MDEVRYHDEDQVVGERHIGLFFFSSRRRHTRWTGDWSSDVCSSDLEPGNNGGRPGRLVGILTNRDVRFATNPNQRVAELMTKENLVTVRESVDMEEAKRLLHTHRIEKLLVVDDEYRCIGLITVKDIEKARLHPNACKDEQGRLRVAAATTASRVPSG